MKSKAKENPLKVKVSNGQLVISIGIETLAYAFEESEFNNPYNEDTGDFEKLYTVTDAKEFAKEIRYSLLEEDEVGNTLLNKMFDKAQQKAVEDGCLGIEEN